ncbi:MAG TPA: hypothetical protein VLB01_03440 [Thermodesulfobacteriota bacterium]|nr:hypothetical protein [Thermodesulfobacteriota bacterium]
MKKEEESNYFSCDVELPKEKSEFLINSSVNDQNPTNKLRACQVELEK